MVSCATMKPVPTSELESRRLIGQWRSGMDQMDIYCSGAFNFELKPAPHLFGDLRSKKVLVVLSLK